MAGRVRRGTEVLDKPGLRLLSDTALEIVAPPRFVSRAGEKLAAFLEAHPRPLAGIHALDVGASTGGFTDCLLQGGASHVTCVDVGRAQLHDKLRRDPRVINLERLNARALDEADLPHPTYDLSVMDLSFISLRLVLAPAWRRVQPGGDLVALIKPQFEAGKEEADRARGVIRDPAIHQRVIEEIRTFAADELPGATEIGLIPSPITGGDGNQEFLIGFHREKR